MANPHRANAGGAKEEAGRRYGEREPKQYNMITFLKIFLGWKGTWFWACRQMQEGKTVRRLRDSGVVRFSYDHGKRRIKAMVMWETSTEAKDWGVSMEDVFATDFEIQVASRRQTLGMGCFATIIGKHTPHRFEIGSHVVIMSHDEKRAYVKDKSLSQGEYVLLKDLKDDTI